MLRASPIVYAHRGASRELPENTLPAFALALELGADAIETDAHLTRDGRVVLAHDPVVAGRVVRATTWSELSAIDLGAKARVPLLEEALSAFPNILFNVDAKQTYPNMIPALLRAVRGHEDRVRIASFSRKNLVRVRDAGYRGETGLSPGEVISALLGMKVAGQAAQIPLAAYGIRLDTQAAIDRFHRLGLRVDFWTVNDPAEAKRLFALGADGVMTDDPRAVHA